MKRFHCARAHLHTACACVEVVHPTAQPLELVSESVVHLHVLGIDGVILEAGERTVDAVALGEQLRVVDSRAPGGAVATQRTSVSSWTSDGRRLPLQLLDEGRVVPLRHRRALAVQRACVLPEVLKGVVRVKQPERLRRRLGKPPMQPPRTVGDDDELRLDKPCLTGEATGAVVVRAGRVLHGRLVDPACRVHDEPARSTGQQPTGARDARPCDRAKEPLRVSIASRDPGGGCDVEPRRDLQVARRVNGAVPDDAGDTRAGERPACRAVAAQVPGRASSSGAEGSPHRAQVVTTT